MNSGLKNEKLLLKIQQEGANSVIKHRREGGVYLFNDLNDEDGVIVGRLQKPKYNINEAQRSLNTDITELLTVVEAPLPPTVPEEAYNTLLAQLSASIAEITELDTQLQNERLGLQTAGTEVEVLTVEVDRLKMENSVLQNELDSTNQRLSGLVMDLQNTVQRMTAESIDRYSLFARLEAVTSERNNLQDQLFGKTARIQAGAKSSGALFTVKSSPTANQTEADIYATQQFSVKGIGRNFDKNKSIEIVNGKDGIVVFNSSDKLIKLTIRKSPEKDSDKHHMAWYSLTANDPNNQVITSAPRTFTIEPKEELKLNIRVADQNAIKSKNSRSNITYIIFQAEDVNGGLEESVSLSVNLRRDRN